MPLTPIDIQQKTFGPELRGYNMDEVDDFLDEVVATLKDYDQRIRDAQDRIRALEAEVATRGEDETAISRALVAAQKQADTILDDAHQEAERIRGDAYDEADQLRADRDAERMTLTQEMARMRATVADLKRRIVDLSASAQADLDAMEGVIAEASESLAEPLAEPAAPEAADEEMASAPGQHLGGWESSPGGDEDAGDWEEAVEPASEPEPAWETPASDWQSNEVGEETADPYATAEDTEEGEEERIGDLADEMADEADSASEMEEEETSAPPGRRPWERGSV